MIQLDQEKSVYDFLERLSQCKHSNSQPFSPRV